MAFHNQKTNQKNNQKTNKEQEELKERLVGIKRVAKTVKGGRIMSFSAISVVGDGKGRVGVGKGKAREVSVAIQKSIADAKMNMHKVNLKGDTIQYATTAKHCASKVYLQPASKGTGVIAGGALRAVLDVVGVQNILSKCYGSTNPVNVVRATIKALKSMDSPQTVAKRRDIPVSDLT